MDNVKICSYCGAATTVYMTRQRCGILRRYRKCTKCKMHMVTVEIDQDLYEKLLAKAGELK